MDAEQACEQTVGEVLRRQGRLDAVAWATVSGPFLLPAPWRLTSAILDVNGVSLR